MIYDLSSPEGFERCKKRINALVKKKAKAEVTEATDDGSDQQRKFFHAMLRIVAQDRGIVFDKFKEAIIIHLGYYQEILGEKVRQHTTEMCKKEYSRLIDDYYRWTIDEGYLIPTSDEYLANQDILEDGE